jgi:hypothetical protein
MLYLLRNYANAAPLVVASSRNAVNHEAVGLETIAFLL